MSSVRSSMFFQRLSKYKTLEHFIKHTIIRLDPYNCIRSWSHKGNEIFCSLPESFIVDCGHKVLNFVSIEDATSELGLSWRVRMRETANSFKCCDCAKQHWCSHDALYYRVSPTNDTATTFAHMFMMIRSATCWFMQPQLWSIEQCSCQCDSYRTSRWLRTILRMNTAINKVLPTDWIHLSPSETRLTF